MTFQSSATGALDSAESAGHSFVQSKTFELLSRAGFVARALIYAIIGVLALKLALGHGGKLTNQQGALHTVAHQPFGKLLLTLVAIGLGGYSLWRFVRAAIGHGPEGADSGFDRVAALGSGIAYGAMCVLAIEILMGAGGGNAANPKQAAAGVFGWPAGVWIVGVAGAITVGTGLYQGYRGITKKFLDDSKTAEMGARTREWISVLGTVGHLARMVVFGLVGVFLIKAAVDYNPSAAVGLDGALAKIVHRSYGPFALGVVAAGPHRVRAVFAQRREVPQDLSARSYVVRSARSPLRDQDPSTLAARSAGAWARPRNSRDQESAGAAVARSRPESATSASGTSRATELAIRSRRLPAPNAAIFATMPSGSRALAQSGATWARVSATASSRLPATSARAPIMKIAEAAGAFSYRCRRAAICGRSAAGLPIFQ